MPAANAIAARSHGRKNNFPPAPGATSGAGAEPVACEGVGGLKEGCGTGEAIGPVDGGSDGKGSGGELDVSAAGGACVTCAGEGPEVVARAASRGASVRSAVTGAVATGAGCVRAGVAGACADWSAARVAVPDRLKFCSSRGPTASLAVVLAVAGGGSAVACARAEAGTSPSPAAANIVVKRKPALIQLPLCA